MWISPRCHSFMKPIVISHGYIFPNESQKTIGEFKLISGYSWDGCRDYASLLTTASVIQYWKCFKEDKYRQYCRDLLLKVVELCIVEWNLRHDDFPIPEDLRKYSPMCLVSVSHWFLLYTVTCYVYIIRFRCLIELTINQHVAK